MRRLSRADSYYNPSLGGTFGPCRSHWLLWLALQEVALATYLGLLYLYAAFSTANCRDFVKCFVTAQGAIMRRAFWTWLVVLNLGAHAHHITQKPRQAPPPAETGPVTHTITVGAVGQVSSPCRWTLADERKKEPYSIQPNRTDTKAGDFVEWEFHSGAHIIIRGDLDYPCIPFEYFGASRLGFNSGEQRVDEDRGDVSNPFLDSSWMRV